MRAARKRIGLAILLLLGGCQNYGALKTELVHDDSVDFAAYRSFAAAPPPESIPGLPTYSELAGRRIQGWINQELERRGLVQAAWGEADLQVAFSVSGQPRTEIWVTQIAWYGGRASAVRYRVGSLAIDMADRRRERMVWHGLAQQQTLDDDFSDERVQRAVVRLLEKFPPPREKKRREKPANASP